MYVLLAVIGVSTPMTLLVETAIRHLVMPPEFEQVRAWLGPQVTPWVWGMVPLTVLATAGAVPLQRYLYRGEFAEREAKLGADKAHDKAVFESLMLSTSAPQFPALLATFGYLCGASPTPVVWTMVLATIGVFALGLFLPPRPVVSASRTPE